MLNNFLETLERATRAQPKGNGDPSISSLCCSKSSRRARRALSRKAMETSYQQLCPYRTQEYSARRALSRKAMET